MKNEYYESLLVCLIVFFLILYAGLNIAYRSKTFGYSFWPGEQIEMWTIEAKIQSDALSLPDKIILDIPEQILGYQVMNDRKCQPLFTQLVKADCDESSSWNTNRTKSIDLIAYTEELLVDCKHPHNLEETQSPSIMCGQLINDTRILIEGEQNASIAFTVKKQSNSMQALREMNNKGNNVLFDFSLYSLPPDTQLVFQKLFLVPLAGLVVVIVRNFVGLKTLGTFMPILIALAFLETKLFTGLFIFFIIIITGLIVRYSLSKLNILLIPRIAALVISVIFFVLGIAILGNRNGWSSSFDITFFPIIVLAWTIERLSIAWEEQGPQAALEQISGSLFVAVLSYLLMSNPFIKHLFFSFPSINLIIFALVLLMGRYSGFRLTELNRFESIVEGT
jgi:hypothetical protein